MKSQYFVTYGEPGFDYKKSGTTEYFDDEESAERFESNRVLSGYVVYDFGIVERTVEQETDKPK